MSPALAWAEQPSKTVLVIGDSISAAYGMQLRDGWVALLGERLGARHRVINASVSGDTTKEGLVRIEPLLAAHAPDIVVIELGGNDALRGFPIAGIRDNLLAMAQAVSHSGARPVLAGMQIPPNYGPRYATAFRDVYAEVADASGAALVPFLLEDVAAVPGMMQRDGIHPEAAAQMRILDNIWPVLEPLIESR